MPPKGSNPNLTKDDLRNVIQYIRKSSANDKRFRDYLKKFDLGNLEYHYIVKSGNPIETIYSSVKEQESDLLFMGASHTDDWLSFFIDGTVDKIFRRVPCSVVTIKHPSVPEFAGS